MQITDQPRYREWYYGTTRDAPFVKAFLDGHHMPRLFLSDVLDVVAKPADEVHHVAPWGGRDHTTTIENLVGKFVVSWNARHGYASVSQVL